MDEQSQAELAWIDNPLSGIIPFSAKDDLVREGKRVSPRQAMEAAQRAVASGETGGVYVFTTQADPARQREMLALNVGGH